MGKGSSKKLQDQVLGAGHAQGTDALPVVMTTGQVAALFGVNFKTVLRWAQSGRLPSSRLPGQRGDHRFTRDEVLEFARVNHLLPILGPSIGKDPQTAQKTESASRSPLVLIVDDEPQIAKVIQRVLHGKCEFQCATDGYQAGALMALNPPSLVFLDLRMPGLDGISVLKFMRSVEQLKTLPVCVISGSESEKLNEALAAGATWAIAKPFSADQIQSVFRQALEASGSPKDSTWERSAA